MCGRYEFEMTLQSIHDYYGVENLEGIRDIVSSPRKDVWPTQRMPVMCRDADGKRIIRPMRWGLIPSWIKTEDDATRIAASCINAKGESIDQKPAFRAAFKRRRAIVAGSAYYEWTPENGRKQRYRLARADGLPLAFAGLWETWKHPVNDELIKTYTIITCEPNAFLGRYHNRQPVILQPAEFDLWLDPEYPHAKGLLAASNAESYAARAIPKAEEATYKTATGEQ